MQSFKLFKESDMGDAENRANAFRNLKIAFGLFFGLGLFTLLIVLIF